MSGPDFLDTNILIYAYDSGDLKKQHIAQELVARGLTGELVISTQVLAEFAATLLHKISPAARPPDIIAILDALAPIHNIVPDAAIVQRAVQARSSYGVHFYDGMIIAAAERGGCARIWSEDLNSGQLYFGIRVENPFRAPASSRI
jgi:predicted nucleic acid-binding protein